MYYRNINKPASRSALRAIQIEESKAGDPRFAAFLREIQAMHSEDSSRSHEENSMFRIMRLFDELTFQYMRESYEVIDQLIVEDFLSSNMKSFANLCGVFLAITVAGQKGEEDKLMRINDELGDGKLFWKPYGRPA
jgi:hypothetical protein